MSSIEGGPYGNLWDTATKVILFLTYCFTFFFLTEIRHPFKQSKSAKRNERLLLILPF